MAKHKNERIYVRNWCRYLGVTWWPWQSAATARRKCIAAMQKPNPQPKRK